jgi:hypothetical protein
MNLVTSGLMETGSFINRLSKRRGMWARAKRRSKDTGKPLVVVGAPSAGVVTGKMAQYSCGSLPCVDLAGCKVCGAPPTDISIAGAIDAPDGGAIVLCQYVLEYVDDIDGAWTEIKRAAGSDDNIFVSYGSQTFLSNVSTGSLRKIVSAPPIGELDHRQIRKQPKILKKWKGRVSA